MNSTIPLEMAKRSWFGNQSSSLIPGATLDAPNIARPQQPREDADHKRRSLKKDKKKSSRHKSSRHKKKKRGHHGSSRRSSRQYTETEATSGWTADDDDNRYQVALWIGESSRTRGSTNSPQKAGSGAREAAEDGDNEVSSPDGEDGDETPIPGNSKQPKSK
ncbi:hypothetical protein THAR02_04238 [Trichoderma harzianum]|uniref:Uncharacterized protein n=1 Tax=Trichoderma harzianum TaxID=5544 RepID=A0A0F9XUA6_TRIHA|nr:hypothetical protein THAR02_04238 [Trichoderma harzianum]